MPRKNTLTLANANARQRSRSPAHARQLTLTSAVPTLSAGPLLIFFSVNSISFFLFFRTFFLFFRSMESHGKTRCVFTPPLKISFLTLTPRSSHLT